MRPNCRLKYRLTFPIFPKCDINWRMMEEIASDEVIEQAYDWLCKRRRDYSANNDVWDVRWRWETIKPQLQADLLAGAYRLSPVRRFQGQETTTELWSSLDALVLKALAIVLSRHLRPHLSERCYHLAGNGGAKAAVRAVHEHLKSNTFVFRTDIKSYYGSINHYILYNMLRNHVSDQRVLNLLSQYLHRTVCEDGVYQHIKRGLPLGCPLSPLMGALYLKPLDDRMAETGLFYARFMDDWVILSPTRWKLRRAIKVVNKTLAELKVKKHPDKTLIGRISRCFDFLGYRFSPSCLSLATKTIRNFLGRITRLYERGADAVRIGQYARRWWRWALAGVAQRVYPNTKLDNRHGCGCWIALLNDLLNIHPLVAPAACRIIFLRTPNPSSVNLHSIVRA
jgi:RNA-directed DNA polymerase